MKVSVQAGDEVSFDWMFDARDFTKNPPDGYPDNDYAIFVVQDGATTSQYKLADVRGIGDQGASGWRAAVYKPENAGEITIGFAAANDRIADFSGPDSQNSVLLVDNVRINRQFDSGYQVSETFDQGHFETLVQHSQQQQQAAG
jgi:hypothetical protein